ncbi:hypothetical protein E2C01_003668 [Portunus trituberculatus]|uniref:Uncharacterized protein n=1 Tax=Portunus trituberculatus TaxID=210409 RepID=A0A5B7CRU7_PORTR|nr:hypothetical protein [Portunus trituberculatus]
MHSTLTYSQRNPYDPSSQPPPYPFFCPRRPITQLVPAPHLHASPEPPQTREPPPDGIMGDPDRRHWLRTGGGLAGEDGMVMVVEEG